jgi:hypothetical protein
LVGEEKKGKEKMNYRSSIKGQFSCLYALEEKLRKRVIGLGGKKSGWSLSRRAISNELTGEDDSFMSGKEEKFRPPSTAVF